MKRISFSVVVFSIFLCAFTGCSGKPGYGIFKAYQIVPFPDQTKGLEDPNLCRIYVIRDNNIGPEFDIHDNKNFIGVTCPFTYLCWDRKPGSTTISNKSSIFLIIPQKITLNLRKGKTYYIRQTRYSAGMGGNLKLLSEEIGKSALKECYKPDYRREKQKKS
jgi:hypothetical protein